MRRVLITGAKGFLGRNLAARLERDPNVRVSGVDVDDETGRLAALVRDGVDVIFHLAGVNRPKREAEFQEGNADLTRSLAGLARDAGAPLIVFSSSIQAELDNPYGRSKREAERALDQYARDTGGRAVVYRLPNVFGKWSRPNYNSVVATFCAGIARGEKIRVDDPDREMSLVYVDDVVAEMARWVDVPADWRGVDTSPLSVSPLYRVTLGGLAERITAFRDSRDTQILPDFSDPLNRCLYATYLSFVGTDDLARTLETRRDERGWLAEVVKSGSFGQVFVSVTQPGVTRGNHAHDTKVEKFCVIRGHALIRLKDLRDGRIVEYAVSGSEPAVIDIPPGCAHSITNTGSDELMTLFWADEIFDRDRPDTFPREVGQ
jgi:UDP-2-acetamido-2,6-beta-L-arabino-hexul-4-ose reductase